MIRQEESYLDFGLDTKYAYYIYIKFSLGILKNLGIYMFGKLKIIICSDQKESGSGPKRKPGGSSCLFWGEGELLGFMWVGG